MSYIEELKKENPDHFYLLQDLLDDNITNHPELAAAIELTGIQCFDKYGRFLILKPDDNNTAPSIAEALSIVSSNMEELCEAIINDERIARLDESNHYEWSKHQSFLDRRLLVSVYGWKVKDLPDFPDLYNQWLTKKSDITINDIPKDPAKQAKVWDLARGLAKLKYPKLADTIDDENSPLFSKISKDLLDVDLDISSKTIKEWLHHKK